MILGLKSCNELMWEIILSVYLKTNVINFLCGFVPFQSVRCQQERFPGVVSSSPVSGPSVHGPEHPVHHRGKERRHQRQVLSAVPRSRRAATLHL